MWAHHSLLHHTNISSPQKRRKIRRIEEQHRVCGRNKSRCGRKEENTGDEKGFSTFLWSFTTILFFFFTPFWVVWFFRRAKIGQLNKPVLENAFIYARFLVNYFAVRKNGIGTMEWVIWVEGIHPHFHYFFFS